jgi:hypothetical protein
MSTPPAWITLDTPVSHTASLFFNSKRVAKATHEVGSNFESNFTEQIADNNC